MTVSPAQRKATAKYNAQNYDRVELRLPRGRKATIEAAAKKELTPDGKEGSLNGLINRLLREYLGMTEIEWKSPGQTAAEEAPAEDAAPAVKATSIEPVAEAPAAVDAEEQ